MVQISSNEDSDPDSRPGEVSEVLLMEEPHPSCGSTAVPTHPMQAPSSRGTMSHPDCHGQEHVPKIGDSLYLCCRWLAFFFARFCSFMAFEDISKDDI